MKRLVHGIAAALLVSTAAVTAAEASPAAAAQSMQSSVAQVAPVTMSRSSLRTQLRPQVTTLYPRNQSVAGVFFCMDSAIGLV